MYSCMEDRFLMAVGDERVIAHGSHHWLSLQIDWIARERAFLRFPLQAVGFFQRTKGRFVEADSILFKKWTERACDRIPLGKHRRPPLAIKNHETSVRRL